MLEIWPSGHYSPVHDHADAHAIIRVLHGEIEVSLFPLLSSVVPSRPHTRQIFAKEDITYITPRLNQVHQLRNLSTEEACVTIQCEFFDYPNSPSLEIAHFIPASDSHRPNSFIFRKLSQKSKTLSPLDGTTAKNERQCSWCQ